MPRRSMALLVMVLMLASCHPAACLYPRAYPKDGETLVSLDDRFPSANIDIIFDPLGVGHAYAENEADLAFAQGFLHGRDRLTQMVVRRAFAWGRLTEILGPDFLDSDRMSRLSSWKIEAEVAELELRPRVIDLLEAYAAGVNLGAKESGQTPEMLVAGTLQGVLGGYAFEPWTLEDSVAFSRALSFLLAAGFPEELARTRVLNRIPEGDPRRAELLQPIGDLGTPIVTDEENSGDAITDPRTLVPAAQALTPSARPRPLLAKDHPASARRPTLTRRLQRLLGLVQSPFGSNAWALSGEHTASGNAILTHDPHLTHDGPSVAYLLHLESDEMLAAGISFAGVPGIVLGHGRDIAWAGPVSNADAADLVRIEPYDGRDDLYLLNAEPKPYEELIQRFKLGPGEGADVFEEVWKLTVFGPVLPPGFGHLVDDGEIYALMWPGFEHPPSVDGTPAPYTGGLSFWDLAKASNVQEAHDAIDRMVTNYQSIVFATKAGDIAYRTSGTLPVRISDEPIGLPRDGRTDAAGWYGKLPGEMKPQLTNPASGIIVAANQRLVASGGPRDAIVGDEAIHPYRAARIRERLETLLEAGPASADGLLEIQQDIESVMARDLAPVLGAACPTSLPGYDLDLLNLICEEIRVFDGRFTTESRAALLYRRLERVLRRKVLEAQLGDEVALQIQGHHTYRFNLYRRILEAQQGIEPAIFDDPETAEREGLTGFVARALPEVIDSIVNDPALGPDPDRWRWGAVHTLTIEGALAGIPLFGGAFTEGPTELDGCGTCIKAEAGDISVPPPESGEAPLNPDGIFAGAVMRMIAVMSDPIEVKLIIDTGSSGHFGNPHFYDQFPLWAAGTPVQMARDRDLIEADATQRVTLTPFGG